MEIGTVLPLAHTENLGAFRVVVEKWLDRLNRDNVILLSFHYVLDSSESPQKDVE